MECWYIGNCYVVFGVEWMVEQMVLMVKYKGFVLVLEFNCSSVVLGFILLINYWQRMYQFFYEEEVVQQQLVVKLILWGQVFLKMVLQMLVLNMFFVFLGVLYVEVFVFFFLMLDIDQGFLLGWVVSIVLVVFVFVFDNMVFEVWLERWVSLEQVLWLLFLVCCCLVLGLQFEVCLVLEVQFQIDLMIFCFWYQVVDILFEEQLVVFDLFICVLFRFWFVLFLWCGNCKQELVVVFIVGWGFGDGRCVFLLFIYGFFGIGKIYMLVMVFLEVIWRFEIKVFICIYINSVVDIYIWEYFYSYVSGGYFEVIFFCVMYMDWLLSQMDLVMLQYCCLIDDCQVFCLFIWVELVWYCVVVIIIFQVCEFRVLVGFFFYIFIDEVVQMLECEVFILLVYVLYGICFVLVGDYMQVIFWLFSVVRVWVVEYMLLYCFFLCYQQEIYEVVWQSCLVFYENYCCMDVIVSFILWYFYVVKGNFIYVRGKVLFYFWYYLFMFCYVVGNLDWDMFMVFWLNLVEIVQVVEKVQEVYNIWFSCWGGCEQRCICVVFYGVQVSVLRQELRRWDLGQVFVGSFEILLGWQFWVVVFSIVYICQSLFSFGVLVFEFFIDVCVFNIVLICVQFQLVVVGDVVVFCFFGVCGKFWESFICECVEWYSVCFEGLFMEQVEQGVVQRWCWFF